MIFSAMRPFHWVKNILVGVALLVSHQYIYFHQLKLTVMAFVIFCLASSATYLLNDVMDRGHDALHPLKKNRPIASGKLSPLQALLVFTGLIGILFGLSLLIMPHVFTACIALYLLLTTLYSWKIKSIPVLDIMALSVFYTLRIFAGTTAISVIPSPWLISFSIFIFLSLALMKRYNQLTLSLKTKLAPNRGYTTEDMPILLAFGVSSAMASAVVLTFYIHTEQASIMYHRPEFLWLILPVLLFWIIRSWILSHRSEMSDDTLLFAMKDKVSTLSAFIILCLIIAGRMF